MKIKKVLLTTAQAAYDHYPLHLRIALPTCTLHLVTAYEDVIILYREFTSYTPKEVTLEFYGKRFPTDLLAVITDFTPTTQIADYVWLMLTTFGT